MLLKTNNRLLPYRLFHLATSSFIDTHIYLFMSIVVGSREKERQKDNYGIVGEREPQRKFK